MLLSPLFNFIHFIQKNPEQTPADWPKNSIKHKTREGESAYFLIEMPKPAHAIYQREGFECAYAHLRIDERYAEEM